MSKKLYFCDSEGLNLSISNLEQKIAIFSFTEGRGKGEGGRRETRKLRYNGGARLATNSGDSCFFEQLSAVVLQLFCSRSFGINDLRPFSIANENITVMLRIRN